MEQESVSGHTLTLSTKPCLLKRQINQSDRNKEVMPTGTVKFFNDEKGFGFISRDDGDDVFVHFSNIEGTGRRSLVTGQQVDFELGQGQKGVEAHNVRPL
jgi:CspA family cold shock protein